MEGTKWESKGNISNYPKNKVCVLYREGSGRMQHTGIYIGNGEFIHAKGSQTGVVKEQMPWRWTHWAIPKGLYDSDSTTPSQDKPAIPITTFPIQAKVTANSGTRVNIRKNASKNSSILMKIKLGETVTIEGEENDWYRITYKTINGYIMKEFLQKD